jgi:seryl-tRNA synthetase
MSSPRFAAPSDRIEGVDFLGRGQAALRGRALQIFAYFDRVFTGLGELFDAAPVRVPTLIPTSTLARCDYFRSFPHMVTFATHLEEDSQVIEDFRGRHSKLADVDGDALASMTTPEAGLSPAVCYHTYALHANSTVPAEGTVYGVCGKCFRYEASNIRDLRRLWDFTMREVVFIGSREWVLAERQRGVELVSRFLDEHEIAAEIRTASDPFFLAPDAVAKSYFQLSSDTKYEIAALLPDQSRLAVGSLNYHSDFFGRAFDVQVEGAAAMHSVCIAFGLERWVHAFVAQHGMDPARWPAVMQRAPEFA